MNNMKLSEKQVEFMLDHWFEPGDVYKIFDSIDRGWLLRQDFELRNLGDIFADVYMNGFPCTRIRTTGECANWLDEMAKIG